MLSASSISLWPVAIVSTGTLSRFTISMPPARALSTFENISVAPVAEFCDMENMSSTLSTL